MRTLKQATETIPIVFAGLADPIGDGIVASLSRPGGNITGFSSFEPAIAGKWLQLLKHVSPAITRSEFARRIPSAMVSGWLKLSKLPKRTLSEMSCRFFT